MLLPNVSEHHDLIDDMSHREMALRIIRADERLSAFFATRLMDAFAEGFQQGLAMRPLVDPLPDDTTGDGERHVAEGTHLPLITITETIVDYDTDSDTETVVGDEALFHPHGVFDASDSESDDAYETADDQEECPSDCHSVYALNVMYEAESDSDSGDSTESEDDDGPRSYGDVPSAVDPDGNPHVFDHLVYPRMISADHGSFEDNYVGDGYAADEETASDNDDHSTTSHTALDPLDDAPSMPQPPREKSW